MAIEMDWTGCFSSVIVSKFTGSFKTIDFWDAQERVIAVVCRVVRFLRWYPLLCRLVVHNRYELFLE